MLQVVWSAMVETVQFNSDACQGTMAVNKVVSQRMLSTEFETGKAPGFDRLPKLFFFVRLFTTKLAARAVLAMSKLYGTKNAGQAGTGSATSPQSLSPARSGGEGEEECA